MSGLALTYAVVIGLSETLQEHLMSTEQNKVIVRRWIEEGWNGHNLAVVDELYAPDFVQHDPTSPGDVTSAAAIKQYVGAFIAGMPDLHFTIDELIAEGDKVVWRFVGTGTQTGMLMGLPPSGVRAAVDGLVVFRLANGRIAEAWVNFNALGLLQALGAIPQM